VERGNCILVFGVSGVGKSWSCNAFVSRHPEYLYYSASTLLREAKASTVEQLRTADAQEIEANQRLLGVQLRRKRENQWSRSVLVDAHGVIDNDQDLIKLPLDAIRSMEPDALVLLEAPAEVVAERRRKDKRSRPNRSLAFIQREIAAERETVLAYGVALGLSVVTDVVDEGYQLDSAILTALRS
jgi:adenylate kinase